MQKKKQAYNINYREKAPGNINDKIFLNNKGDVDTDILANSYKSVGIPGTVYGLNLAYEKFGSGNLTLENLLSPAIKLAENGYEISYANADALYYAKDRLNKDPYTKNIFFKDGQILQAGDLLKQKDLANTLKRISKNGTKEFYTGKTAELLIKASNKNQGLLKINDLINYKAEISEPVKSSYKKYKILSSPLPSSGGITLIEILNILENLNFSNIGINSAEYIHYLVEAMNFAFYDRNYNLGDPLYVKDINKIVDKIISKKHAKEIFEKIKPNKHIKSQDIDKNYKNIKEGVNTTHYVIIDKDGNMVSNTYSLNYSFGIAKAVPGAGFLLNNVVDDFTIKANQPNAYGLIQDEENLVGSNKQPLSSMAPTIVLDEYDRPILATGSPGGSRIITTVLQVILNYLEYHYNIATAVASPRIHSQLWPDKVLYEEGISQDTINILEKMGHHLEKFRAMGSAQSASVETNINDNSMFLFATADPRREGSDALAINK